MRFLTALATDFAVFFTALVGARLLTSWLLSRGIGFSLDDLIETAIAAAIIALGRVLLGKTA